MDRCHIIIMAIHPILVSWSSTTCYPNKQMIFVFFREKAQAEPYFELTKPSTGQEYKSQNNTNKSQKTIKKAAEHNAKHDCLKAMAAARTN